jgi:hypothetical protein
MLSSRSRFLWWARQSRAGAAPTSFRAMAQRWRPVIAVKRPQPVFKKPAGRRIDINRPRPAWSPWLWLQ